MANDPINKIINMLLEITLTQITQQMLMKLHAIVQHSI